MSKHTRDATAKADDTDDTMGRDGGPAAPPLGLCAAHAARAAALPSTTSTECFNLPLSEYPFVVDARTREEYDRGHICCAWHLKEASAARADADGTDGGGTSGGGSGAGGGGAGGRRCRLVAPEGCLATCRECTGVQPIVAAARATVDWVWDVNPPESRSSVLLVGAADDGCDDVVADAPAASSSDAATASAGSSGGAGEGVVGAKVDRVRALALAFASDLGFSGARVMSTSQFAAFSAAFPHLISVSAPRDAASARPSAAAGAGGGAGAAASASGDAVGRGDAAHARIDDEEDEDEDEDEDEVEVDVPQPYPCMVAPGLFLGSATVARQTNAFTDLRIARVVNCTMPHECANVFEAPSAAEEGDEEEGEAAGGAVSHQKRSRDEMPAAAEAPMAPQAQYLRCAVVDADDQDMGAAFAASHAFLVDAAAAGVPTLVHCHQGRSRSVAVLAHHLMRSRGLGYDDALALIRRARPSARPNAGFERQLRAVEATLTASSSPR